VKLDLERVPQLRKVSDLKGAEDGAGRDGLIEAFGTMT